MNQSFQCLINFMGFTTPNTLPFVPTLGMKLRIQTSHIADISSGGLNYTNLSWTEQDAWVKEVIWNVKDEMFIVTLQDVPKKEESERIGMTPEITEFYDKLVESTKSVEHIEDLPQAIKTGVANLEAVKISDLADEVLDEEAEFQRYLDSEDD